jgi:aerobic carbon-monoxide dehydrogenase medium subunit
MIPAAFDYEVAESVEHATELLSSREDAKLLAGGHSLLPLMRLRFARPGTLVDVGRLADLRYVRNDGDAIAIGALTRHHDLESNALLQKECGLLAHAAGEIGDPMVRRRGTIGGSVAHADPAGDLGAVLLALDAELVVSDGRKIPATEFFRGVFETALGPNEMLTEIRVPKLNGAGWSYLKFRNRSQDWATVGVAAVTRKGSCAVGLANMGATSLRASAAEKAYAKGGAAAAGEVAAEGTDPPEDTAASAEFRRHLARVLVRRALEEAKG